MTPPKPHESTNARFALATSAPSVQPITESDDFLRAVLQEAELPALLPALAQALGDLDLIRHDAGPGTGPIGAIVPPQGGMSAEVQADARRLALAGLQRLRDAGPKPLDAGDTSALRELMQFITGPISEDYLPLAEHELAFPEDTGAPTWTAEELAPGREFRVAIVGAGMSGMVAAHRLRQAGVEVTVFEKNSDVGGTWLENAYPGCRLDTSNFGYSYSFAQTRDWPQQYSPRDAIFSYFRGVAEQFELLSMVHFNSEVTEMAFDEASSSWRLSVVEAGGSKVTHEADAVISAVGQLNRANIPNIPGRETFRGRAWHTAHWDHSADLTGLKVAVIGTGASAFQVIPSIANVVGELSVFQRTPPWILPAPDYHADVRAGMKWLLQHVPNYHRWYRFFQFWTTVEGRRLYVQVDPTWEHPVSVSAYNEELRLALEGYLAEQFADRPDLLAKVVPNYPPGAKRMLRDNGTWAATLKRSNVDLVTDGIARIEPTGIRTTDGVLHEADVIIYGTGFRASEFLMPMSVRGRGGVELHEQWGADVRAYLGVTIPEFPNLFCLYGPNTNLVVNGSIVLFSEMAAEYVLDSIRLLLTTGNRTMEVTSPVFEEYNRRIDEANRQMAWGASGVNSWYKSASGRVSQNWPLTILDYWQATRQARPEEYTFDGANQPVEA